MSHQGRGYIRGQQSTQPATPEARAIKSANADNGQVAQSGETAAVPHDSRSGIDKAASATRPLPPSSHGGVVQVAGQGAPKGNGSGALPRKAQ